VKKVEKEIFSVVCSRCPWFCYTSDDGEDPTLVLREN